MRGLASTETLRQDHIRYIQGMATELTEPEKDVQESVVRNQIGEEAGEMILFGTQFVMKTGFHCVTESQ